MPCTTKTKRKKNFVTKDIAKKIVANPKTPPGLKAYWKKKFNLR